MADFRLCEGLRRTDRQIDNSRKSIRWSIIPIVLLFMIVNWIEKKGSSPKRDEVLQDSGVLFLGSSPEGADDLCFLT